MASQLRKGPSSYKGQISTKLYTHYKSIIKMSYEIILGCTLTEIKFRICRIFIFAKSVHGSTAFGHNHDKLLA
jgi:hypothetical protein